MAVQGETDFIRPYRTWTGGHGYAQIKLPEAPKAGMRQSCRGLRSLTSAGGLNEASSVPDPNTLGDMVPRPWSKDHRSGCGNNCGHKCRFQGRYSDRGGSDRTVPGSHTK